MSNVKIEISIPQDILLSINKNPKELSDEMKKLMAIELYHTGKLSLGKCSELIGLCKEDFIKVLSERGCSLFNWDDEEIKSEFEAVDKLLRVMENESNY